MEEQVDMDNDLRTRTMDIFKFFSKNEKVCGLSIVLDWIFFLDKTSTRLNVFEIYKEFEKVHVEEQIDKKGLCQLLQGFSTVQNQPSLHDQIITEIEAIAKESSKKKEELPDELKKILKKQVIDVLFEYEQELQNAFTIYHPDNIDGEVVLPWEIIFTKNKSISFKTFSIMLRESEGSNVSQKNLLKAASILHLSSEDDVDFSAFVVCLALLSHLEGNEDEEEDFEGKLREFLRKKLHFRSNEAIEEDDCRFEAGNKFHERLKAHQDFVHESVEPVFVEMQTTDGENPNLYTDAAPLEDEPADRYALTQDLAQVLDDILLPEIEVRDDEKPPMVLGDQVPKSKDRASAPRQAMPRKQKPIAFAEPTPPPPPKAFDYSLALYRRLHKPEPLGVDLVALKFSPSPSLLYDRSVPPPMNPKDTELAHLALKHLGNKALPQAFHFLDQLLTRLEKAHETDFRSLIFCFYVRGMAHLKAKSFDRALTCFQTALKMNDKIIITRLERIYCFLGFGYTFFHLEDYRLAAQSFQKVLSLLQEMVPVEDLSVGMAYNNLACALFKLGHASLAHDYLKIAIAILDLGLGPSHEFTLTAKRNSEIVLSGRFELPLKEGRSYVVYYQNDYRGIGQGGFAEVKSKKLKS